MTEQEFEVMLVELRQLRKGVSEAVRQIVEHEGEINALQSVIQLKGLVTGQELDVANAESAWQLSRFLDGTGTGDPSELSRRLSQSRVCRGRHARPATRGVRPRR
jgi:hypothetical protein